VWAIGSPQATSVGQRRDGRSAANWSTIASVANRLRDALSPYLRQHADNPVDWWPWCDEAFEEARARDVPVLLSVGYAACHWCHVMAHESFEDEGTAALMNEHYVSIKVDREERPDVDKIYMTFVQATTGAGGWPMSVFLTPDLKPFYGGTYFPPEPRYGRPSFIQLVERIAELWVGRRADLEQNAEQVSAQLSQAMTKQPAVSVEALNPELIRAAGAAFKEMYDPQNGGFGRAPKFPQPSQPQFLLRYAHRFGDDAAKRMVLHTCERMAAGGINDQLGGGFARYSVDAEWLVPHFEKMLYDNAQLVQLYLDAYLVAKAESENGARNPQPATEFAAVARGILNYVLRDMTHPEGGFNSAEDADSEGHEGKFYCWTRAELSQLLTVEEFNVAVHYYGITEQGNFVDHSHPTPLAGQNVLSIVQPLTPSLSPSDGERVPEGRVRGASESIAADEQLLASAKRKMTEVRASRIRPHLDDKILASWNGLMLGAFARAYAVLGDEAYRAAAEKNLKFIQDKLWDAESKTLYHRWRDGERDSVQLLDAYAFLLGGVVELYEATLAPGHLQFAIELAEAMLARFHDAEGGGFWQSAAGATDLILRVKDDTDGAEPSGNSVATLALLRLAAIADRDDFRTAAEGALRAGAAKLEQAPQAVPCLLQALDFWADEPDRVVITGEPATMEVQALLRGARSGFRPNLVVLGVQGPVGAMARALPTGEAAAFVCTGQACRAPVRTAAELAALLRV